jgi:signal transduction histidine kinase
VTAWYGGLRASLIATALAIIVEDYFFIAPFHSLEMTFENVVRICVFVLVALLISWIDSGRKKAIAERDRLITLEHQARTAAETANHVKDEFLAMVSHELRTPLNVILGWVKMLRSGKLSAEAASDALARIERNAELQQRLIEDLIDVSRIAAGKLRIDSQVVDMRKVIEEGLNAVTLAARSKQIEVRLSGQKEELIVLGDPYRLQQVVWNLLSNAIKFTPQRGHVELVLTKVEDYARITICDTGRGIDSDLLSHIFERFRQGENDRKGMGLGLSIVRHIVELHGGSVYAESAGKDQGSTFTLNLPLAQAATTDSAIPVERFRVAAGAGVSGSSLER